MNGDNISSNISTNNSSSNAQELQELAELKAECEAFEIALKQQQDRNKMMSQAFNSFQMYQTSQMYHNFDIQQQQQGFTPATQHFQSHTQPQQQSIQSQYSTSQDYEPIQQDYAYEPINHTANHYDTISPVANSFIYGGFHFPPNESPDIPPITEVVETKENSIILASGFTRTEIEKKHNLIVPGDIKQLIGDILNQIKFFVFDICTTDSNVIKHDGKVFSILNGKMGTMSAGDSYGRKNGCCSIKIRKLNQDELGMGFGITSDVNNIKTNKHIYCWNDSCYTYYEYSTGDGKVSGTEGDIFEDLEWNEGDIIKMEWNDKGILKYSRNNKQHGRIKIKKGLVYCPCVCRHTWGDVEVEIM